MVNMMDGDTSGWGWTAEVAAWTWQEHVKYHVDVTKVAYNCFLDFVRDFSTSGPWTMFPKHLEERVNNFNFPPLMDVMWPALYYMVVLSVTRYILQYFVFRRFAMFCRDLKEVKYTPDKTLNAFMTKKNKITLDNIGNITQVTGKSEAAIIEYVRLKTKSDKNEIKITKFIEALWRSMFYGLFVWVGVRTLIYPNVASWVVDHRFLSNGWPEGQFATDQVMFYYAIELGAYFHQLLWTEVSRSDSVEMIAHHFITIALMLTSHIGNLHRYGTMLMFLHDISDVFLELAKCFNYVSQVPRWKHFHYVCDALFAGFAISFFFCRLVFFPKVFFVSTFAYTYCNHLGLYWYLGMTFVVLMFLLFCLHIFWFYLTIKMIYRLLSPEGITKDERSDDESGSDDEFSEKSGKPKPLPIARKKSKKSD
jgi:hypothetical protein